MADNCSRCPLSDDCPLNHFESCPYAMPHGYDDSTYMEGE